MKKVSQSPLIWLTFSILTFLAVGFVTIDSLFGLTNIRWHLPSSGYVGEPMPKTLQVPCLVGTMLSLNALPDPLEFACQITYVYHPTAPATTILQQTPKEGSLRKITDEPCPLSLVVSMGKEQIPLPKLNGLDVREAEITLRALGLIPQRVYVHHQPQHLNDRILTTEPSQGTLMQRGDTVVLQVGQSPPALTIPCPDLLGLTLQEAVLVLQRVGLTIGDVHEELLFDPWQVREGYVDGVISAQNHPIGSFLPHGHPVDVTITTTTNHINIS